MMGRTCSVGAHETSFEINEALIVERQSNRAIASQYNLDRNAIQRHRAHIPQLLLQGSRALEVFEADVILDRLELRYEEALAVLEAAKADGDPRLTLSAIDRAGRQVDRLAEIRGDISRQPVANIVLSAEWVE